jgi:four helix bundle protein
MEQKNYTDLNVWLEAKNMVKLVYENTAIFPPMEQNGLGLQMRNTAISVPAKIAEGIGRTNKNDCLEILYNARGCLYQLETQIYVAEDLNYLSAESSQKMLDQLITCRKLLAGYIKYRRNDKERDSTNIA